MKYKKVIEGRFVSRPNRFIAKVVVDGVEETVHVKNTGRCKELLIPDAKVYLSVSDNPERKTKYDLIAVDKNTDNGVLLINMDSQIPNDVTYEWLVNSKYFGDNAIIKREYKYKNSRFDFYVESAGEKIFLEVKGVTLENSGVASFPDAPTERGIKHTNELVSALEQGYKSYILFVIQMKEVHVFKPNDITHKAFGDALRNARKAGVNIIAIDCIVTPDEMMIDEFVPVCLD